MDYASAIEIYGSPFEKDTVGMNREILFMGKRYKTNIDCGLPGGTTAYLHWVWSMGGMYKYSVRESGYIL